VIYRCRRAALADASAGPSPVRSRCQRKSYCQTGTKRNAPFGSSLRGRADAKLTQSPGEYQAALCLQECRTLVELTVFLQVVRLSAPYVLAAPMAPFIVLTALVCCD
jgi:hypothetical protein